MDRLHSNLTREYSLAPGKLQNYENPLMVESKRDDDD